jgi:hypothetical protein
VFERGGVGGCVETGAEVGGAPVERFTEVRTVVAPVERCFDVLTDADRAHEWLTIARTVWAEGGQGLGRRLHAEGSYLGVSLHVTQTVDVWDPPTRYGWSGDDPIPLRFRFDLDELGPARTRLEAVAVAEIDGLFSMGARLAARSLRRQFARSGDRLKQLMES